eukprot:5175673-Alexandrium_andersonii.AAC.1
MCGHLYVRIPVDRRCADHFPHIDEFVLDERRHAFKLAQIAFMGQLQDGSGDPIPPSAGPSQPV